MTSPTTLRPDVIPEILTAWQALAAREPWHRLPTGDHLQQLAELLHPLLHVAGGGDDPGLHAAYTRIAAEVGRRRREDAVSREALFGDFHLLRHAVWATLRERVAGEAATLAIMRVDVAISVCIRAALLGYHQPEIGVGERWGELMEQVARESPLWPEGPTS